MKIDSRIVHLQMINELEGGGKARGLKDMIDAGLNVPQGFVIIGGESGLPAKLSEEAKFLGWPVAVRSSAMNEDGASVSFAGQYQTFLNVGSYEALEEAVSECIHSARSERVAGYRENLLDHGSSRMAVVVQRMVEASKAGVLFTADPVTGSRDHIVIEVVSGIGEKLVSGSEVPSRYTVNRDGEYIADSYVREGMDISSGQMDMLVNQALIMEKYLEFPVDMEWAIDNKGRLFWLQVRPITVLEIVDIHEFDYGPVKDGQFFTKANIGEMMPGAVTPLTMFVFGDAVDYSIWFFYKMVGALTGKTIKERFVCSFSGHLFFNLDQMFTIAGRVLGSNEDTITQNLLGRPLIAKPRVEYASFPVRLFNIFRMFRYILLHKKYTKKIERAAETFTIDLNQRDAVKMYKSIDQTLSILSDAYAWHLCVSSHSGTMNSILVEIIKKGGGKEDELNSLLAELLTNIDGIESANVLASLETLAGKISDREFFFSMDDGAALLWLKSDKSGEAGMAFKEILERHGHRCIREAELREKDWGEDPVPLIKNLRGILKSPRRTSEPEKRDTESEILAKYPDISRSAFQWALNNARRGVWGREHTKSLVIKIQSRFKHAYRHLAGLMVRDGLLPDEDCVYFLTHKELGQLVLSGDMSLSRKTVRRRRLLSEQMRLKFQDITRGAPQPISEKMKMDEDRVLRGTPVSSGIVRGPVKMVRSVEDAEMIRPGEIMVAEFTDIGWTPFYSVAAGLVTEVGCTLSHGAVVAREYGLPMVTAIPGIMDFLKNGDEIEIDGREGTVHILAEKGATV